MTAAAQAVDLVLFDCDGTLVDSEIVSAQAWAQYTAVHGVTMSAAQALASFKGVGMGECVAEVERLRGAPLPDTFVAELRALMAQLLHAHLQPIPGALDMVQKLSVPFCLASNAPREKIELCLKVTNLLPYFEGRIFSAYDVQSWKPDPDLFLHAARTMGVSPDRCAVVEDSLPGVQAGLAAGMQVFALWHRDHDDELPPNAHVIRTLAELPARINALS